MNVSFGRLKSRKRRTQQFRYTTATMSIGLSAQHTVSCSIFLFFWLLYYAQQYTVYTVYIMDIRLDHLFQCDSRHLYKLTASHPNEKRKKHEEKFKKNDVGRKFYFKVTHDHEIRLQSHTTPLSIYHQPFTTTPTPQ